MSVIAFVAPQAAAGKTTSVLALAEQLGSFGAATLVMDFDPNGDATAAIGRARTPELSHVLRYGLSTRAAVAPTHFPHVDLLPASPRLDRLQDLVWGTDTRNIPSALSEIASGYTYVLVDCAAGIDYLTRIVLTLSNMVVVTVTPESDPASTDRLLDDVTVAAEAAIRTLTIDLNGTRGTGRGTARARPLATRIPYDENVERLLTGDSAVTLPGPGVAAYRNLASEIATATAFPVPA